MPVGPTSSAKLPLWARALRGFDRVARSGFLVHQIVRDELLLAWLRPELREALTTATYSDLLDYLPGGATFEAGLFGWEEALLELPSTPRSGRVLLAGAGGGRELKALLARGYDVTAFEPNPVLFEGACRVASGHRTARVLRGTYADLVRAAEGRGALAELRAQSIERPFDWVWFGWGSFAHVTDRAEQIAVLGAARALAPQAPLALSFLRRSAEDAGRPAVLRARVRTALRRAGGPSSMGPGLGYDFAVGFVYRFTEDELHELAALAGYRIDSHDARVFPHAVLSPDARAVASRSDAAAGSFDLCARPGG